MTYPIRWYYLLSSWIFMLSALYPLHKISTFPLNLIAVIGCHQCIISPFKEHWLKTLYILFIHIAPFTWIPYEISTKTIIFAIAIIIVYLLGIAFISKDPIYIYKILSKERHTKLHEFLADRFGLPWDS